MNKPVVSCKAIYAKKPLAYSIQLVTPDYAQSMNLLCRHHNMQGQVGGSALGDLRDTRLEKSASYRQIRENYQLFRMFYECDMYTVYP